MHLEEAASNRLYKSTWCTCTPPVYFLPHKTRSHFRSTSYRWCRSPYQVQKYFRFPVSCRNSTASSPLVLHYKKSASSVEQAIQKEHTSEPYSTPNMLYVGEQKVWQLSTVMLAESTSCFPAKALVFFASV